MIMELSIEKLYPLERSWTNVISHVPIEGVFDPLCLGIDDQKSNCKFDYHLLF
jgi:hypothetical protein